MLRSALPPLTLALVLSAPAFATPTFVQVGDVTSHLSAWRVVDVRSGGVARVSTTQPDASGGAGSLELALPAPGDDSYRAEVEILSPDTVLSPEQGLVPAQGGYGLLSDLHDLLISWYRDSSSTSWAGLGPAVRVYIYDPDLGANGSSSIMIWEPIYNGYAAGPGRALPEDQWVHSRLDDEIFWRQPLYLDGLRVPRGFCGVNPSECYVYDRRLQDWGFGPRSVIFGFSISAGSGWMGSFLGYVDNLNLELTQARTWIWDFEPGAGAAPALCETVAERRHRQRQARRHARRP